jgi:hypothetical protein
MIRSTARMQTGRAKEYLVSLASASRIGALNGGDDDTHALLQLPKGYCVLTAGGQFLDVAIYASSMSDVVMLEDIVSDRLDAVAGDDELHYQWIVLPASATESLTEPPTGSLHFAFASSFH